MRKVRNKFVRSDDPDALHDHPWDFISLVVWGSYQEITTNETVERRRGNLAIRRAAHRHRVELLRDDRGHEKPCLTIVLTGSRERTWGFWCTRAQGDTRFIGWQDFGGGGCGELDDDPPT